jgi:predicted glutamine amidotransferase
MTSAVCRLFGMSGVPAEVEATFWLLEAPDSLALQSRREPDGTGLGVFEAGQARVMKQAIAAYEDRAFAEEARTVRSKTFVAHVRFASTGGLDTKNTHPFTLQNRLFAHNGVIGDLERLERELGAYRQLVGGDTDSERFFALVTKAAEDHGGDVGVGITAAARWVATNLPLFALNLILTTADELWALRYPATHELWVLNREAGGPHGCRHLELASAAGRIRVRAGDLALAPAVVLASERMDENPAWRPLDPGELLHVDRHRHIDTRIALPDAPAHPLTLADLEPRAAASQRGPGAGA